MISVAVLTRMGGWQQEQSSLVAYMDVSILLMHKRANPLGRGGTDPPSAQEETNLCAATMSCSLCRWNSMQRPCHLLSQELCEVLQLETPLAKCPCVLPEVPVLPTAPSWRVPPSHSEWPWALSGQRRSWCGAQSCDQQTHFSFWPSAK